MPPQTKKPINIFDEIKKLNFPAGHFMVVGSGIMAVKGIREAYDLDIVVSQKLFDKCKKGDWKLQPWTRTGRLGKEWLKGDIADLMIEIQSKNEDYDLDKLKKEGELVHGVWFLSLAQLIKFKKDYGRDKDLADVALIERYLENNAA